MEGSPSHPIVPVCYPVLHPHRNDAGNARRHCPKDNLILRKHLPYQLDLYFGCVPSGAVSVRHLDDFYSVGLWPLVFTELVIECNKEPDMPRK